MNKRGYFHVFPSSKVNWLEKKAEKARALSITELSWYSNTMKVRVGCYNFPMVFQTLKQHTHLKK